jgi:hypothetical protein
MLVVQVKNSEMGKTCNMHNEDVKYINILVISESKRTFRRYRLRFGDDIGKEYVQ